MLNVICRSCVTRIRGVWFARSLSARKERQNGLVIKRRCLTLNPAQEESWQEGQALRTFLP